MGTLYIFSNGTCRGEEYWGDEIDFVRVKLMGPPCSGLTLMRSRVLGLECSQLQPHNATAHELYPLQEGGGGVEVSSDTGYLVSPTILVCILQWNKFDPEVRQYLSIEVRLGLLLIPYMLFINPKRITYLTQ